MEIKEKCLTCHNRLLYSDQFDAIYCPTCNRWIEKKCNDPDCLYCQNRPDQPLTN